MTRRTIKSTLNGNVPSYLFLHIGHLLNFPLHGRYAASAIMTMTYGKSTPTSYTDYEVIQVNKCLHRFGMTALPGAWLVDSYPILRYVPGYLNLLKQWHNEELQLFKEQMDVVRKEMVCSLSAGTWLEAESVFSLSRHWGRRQIHSRSTCLSTSRGTNSQTTRQPISPDLCLGQVPIR